MKKISLLLLISAACSFTTSLSAQTSIWDGAYTDQQAERGQLAYSANCESCHGSNLGGNSNSPGLSGMGFMFIWEGRSLAELYTSMRDNMPSDRPASLSKQSYEDLLAFLPTGQ